MTTKKLARRQRELGLTEGRTTPNSYDKAQLRRLCAGHTDRAVEVLVSIMETCEDPGHQIKACAELMRWAYGGPEVRAGERLPNETTTQQQSTLTLRQQELVLRAAADEMRRMAELEEGGE